MVSWRGLGDHPGLSFQLEPEPEDQKKLPDQEQRPWVKARDSACLPGIALCEVHISRDWLMSHPHQHTHTPTQGHWIWLGEHSLWCLTRTSTWKGSSKAASPPLTPGPRSSGPHCDMRLLLQCHAVFHAMPLRFLSVFLKNFYFKWKRILVLRSWTLFQACVVPRSHALGLMKIARWCRIYLYLTTQHKGTVYVSNHRLQAGRQSFHSQPTAYSSCVLLSEPQILHLPNGFFLDWQDGIED